MPRDPGRLSIRQLENRILEQDLDLRLWQFLVRTLLRQIINLWAPDGEHVFGPRSPLAPLDRHLGNPDTEFTPHDVLDFETHIEIHALFEILTDFVHRTHPDIEFDESFLPFRPGELLDRLTPDSREYVRDLFPNTRAVLRESRRLRNRVRRVLRDLNAPDDLPLFNQERANVLIPRDAIPLGHNLQPIVDSADGLPHFNEDLARDSIPTSGAFGDLWRRVRSWFFGSRYR